jgi:hypothetical protein
MKPFALVAVALVALAANGGRSAAAPACHPIVSRVAARVNLDRDRSVETVREWHGATDCAHTSFIESVTVDDVCAETAKSYVLAQATGSAEPVGRLERTLTVDADGRRGSELLFLFHDLSSKPQTVLAGLVHLTGAPGACPTPHFLFRHRSSGTFNVFVADLTKRFAGKEIRLVEAGTTSLFRYSRARDTYVPYR